jgi:hypothetical protein
LTFFLQVDDGGLVATFGEGFFHRAVCSVTISYDGKYICGIGSDDHHAMGIWDVSSYFIVWIH